MEELTHNTYGLLSVSLSGFQSKQNDYYFEQYQVVIVQRNISSYHCHVSTNAQATRIWLVEGRTVNARESITLTQRWLRGISLSDFVKQPIKYFPLVPEESKCSNNHLSSSDK